MSILLAFCLLVAPLARTSDKEDPKERFQQPGPVRLDHDGERWAERTLKKMSLEEKIGQMFMIWARAKFVNVNSPDYLELRDTMRKYHIGGFGLTVALYDGVLLKSEPFEAAALTNQLQRDSDLPLMFAADFERGVGMRLNGSTTFPHAMAFGAAGDTKLAEEFGRITAREARAVGVEWNWFPVADVNSNPLNPIINTRAFGEDPKRVGEMVAAYIKGAREAGMLTTLKHFPGHGDTGTDSHLALAMVGGDRAHLESIELPPFRRGIEAGADAVMIAHVTVPAIDPAPDHVASNSPLIVTDLLKNELKFKGIVVTDALDMEGLLRLYAGRTPVPTPPGNVAATQVSPSAAAAVATVKAGNDMLIIPADLDAAYNGVLDAVRRGEIPEQQIDASVLKILKAKASVGLDKARLVDLDHLQKLVAEPKNVAEAQEIADRTITLVKDGGVLPVGASTRNNGTKSPGSAYQQPAASGGRVAVLIFTDDLRSESGRAFVQQVRSRVPDANVVWIDANTTSEATTLSTLAAANSADRVIAAVYEVPNAGRKLAIGSGSSSLLQTVLDRAAHKTIVVAMGNPYFATEYPQIQTLLCAFSNAPVSEISAARAVFGEIPIRGRMPVTVPQVAQRGAGIDRSQVAGGNHENSKDVAAR